MARFWVSWALWEKMVFVLACAILFALVLGGLKHVYNHWRLGKYSKIAAGRPTISRPCPQSASDLEEGVPFGIRAIERGVEVEGVYISRAQTPAASPNPSGTSSLRNGPEQIIVDDSPQHIQAPVGRKLANIIPAMPWLRSRNRVAAASTFSFDRMSTPGYLQTPSSLSLNSLRPSLQSESQNSRDGSSDNLRKPPKALLPGNLDDARRFGSAQEEPERLAGLIVSPSKTRSKPRSSDDSHKTGGSLSGSGIVRERADSQAKLLPEESDIPPLSPLGSNPVSLVDLESLNTHRLSHAAETGQLTPRSRTKESSPGVKSAKSSISNEEPADYFSIKPRQTFADAGSATRPKYEFASGFQFPKRIADAHAEAQRAASLLPARALPEGTKDQSVTTQSTTGSPSATPRHRHSLSGPIAPHTRPEQHSDTELEQGTFSDSQARPETTPERRGRKLQKKRASAESSKERSFSVHGPTPEGYDRSEDGKRAPSKASQNPQDVARFSTEGEASRPRKKLQKKRPGLISKESSFTEQL